MNTSKMYYKIFDCCKVVEGPTRCIIYDLQRKKYYSVSKYLNTFLEKIGIHEVNSTAYNNTDQELINYLLSKEILFVMDECLINQFPASDETWLYPAHITNAIITLSKPFCFNLEFLLTQLDEIICRDIVFIFDGYLPSIEYLDEIYKSFEVRAFFIDNEWYSMAIFSQNDEQTKTDFRQYNSLKPNRFVPFRLPQVIILKLVALMKQLNYQTGSIDMVCNKKGEFIFLEVNPVGQFGMTSIPCNYCIEKIIAEKISSYENIR
jgi:hypothetical protein